MPVRQLSELLQKVAQNELNEDPSRTRLDIDCIKKWLSTQSSLNARTEDQWILSFLRGCKFDYNRTKQKLEVLYTIKKNIPEFFSNRDPFSPEIQAVLEGGFIIVLPKTAREAGPRIIILRAKCDSSKIPASLFAKVLLMVLEILYVEDDNSVVTGICIIAHLEDLPYTYLLQLTPKWLKNISVCMLNAYPTRLKEIHYVNFPLFFRFVYKVIEIFLPKKIRDRIRIHQNCEDLGENIPKSIVPNDFGGSEKSCKEIAAEWKLKVESYRDWFLEDEFREA